MAKKMRYYSGTESDMLGNSAGSWDEMPSEVKMVNYPATGYISDMRYPDSRADIDAQISANESVADKQRTRNKY